MPGTSVASRHRARAGSSRRLTPRSVTAARASTSALTASSSRRRSPTRAEPLITAVEVAPATEQDGPQAKHLIDVNCPSGALHGYSATPPMGPVRSAPSSPTAMSGCWRRWRPGMVKPDRFAKREFRSISRPGPSPAPPARRADPHRAQRRSARAFRESRLRCLRHARPLRPASDAGSKPSCGSVR